MPQKEKSYNESIKELEAILARIEDGGSDVDVLAGEVARAAELIKICKDKLYKTDEEIKKVLDKLD
ncbi:MAG: exodeoxyribonuclease VII small subunit [Prevotella sp.]|nr:exodeoxyribonuclease VII small subunit [Prevotella sp.]